MNMSPSIRPDFGPGRLWSLWDMQRINGEALCEVVNKLNRLGGFLIHHEGFDAYKAWSEIEKTEPKTSAFFADVSDQMPWLREGLLRIGADLTDRTAEELIDKLNNKTCSRNDVYMACIEMNKRLQHEMGKIGLYIVDPNSKARIEKACEQFGEDIIDKFTSISYEVDEAGKCLGLDRSTAAVFHLMRVMEIGVKAASKSLGIPDNLKGAERNWGVMLRKFKEEITRRDSMGQAGWKNIGDKTLFPEIYVSLDAVRNAWRNATMHVESKYTLEEAEHIWGAVKGFMKKLSSRCDENGDPKA